MFMAAMARFMRLPRMAYIMFLPLRLDSTTPASFSTRRWWETSGWVRPVAFTSSPAVALPDRASFESILWRVLSQSSLKTPASFTGMVYINKYLIHCMGAGPGRIFAAEFAGTLVLVFLAAGSVVADERNGGSLGAAFVALMPAVGVAAGVYLFGPVSMAHLNPAVTLGFWVLGRVSARAALLYVAAQVSAALLAALLVALAVGSEADVGANAPGPFPYWQLMAAEVAASAALMCAVVAAVKTGGLRGAGGLAIGAAVGIGILAFGDFSGASMNPARSLGPAAAAGNLEHLWLYFSSSLAGAGGSALALRALGQR